MTFPTNGNDSAVDDPPAAAVTPPSPEPLASPEDGTALPGRRLPQLTDRALRRLRALEAAVLLAGLATREARGVRQVLDIPMVWVVILALVHLSVTSGVSLAAAHARTETARGRFERAELGLDVLLACAVVIGFGLRADSLLFAVPLFCIVHAGLRFRLAGAALTWGALAVAALGASLRLPNPWSSSAGPGGLLEPLALLLLVGLPTGYLAEFLLAELADLRRARGEVERRAALLSNLIAAGCELIGADRRKILSRTATIALSLGFDEVAVQRWNPKRAAWELVAGAGAGAGADLFGSGGNPDTTAGVADPPPVGVAVPPPVGVAVPPPAGVAVPPPALAEPPQIPTPDPAAPEAVTAEPVAPVTPAAVALPPSGDAPWKVRVLSRTEADHELQVQPLSAHDWVATTSLSWGDDGEGARIIAWSTQPLGAGDARREALAVLAAQAAAALANASLHGDLSGLKDEFEHRALHDSLTGLANRARLLAEVSWHLEANPSSTALVFCDLDGFKAINDTHGHHVGDAVLVAVARRLSAVAGPDRLVARLGGDEFVMVVPDAINQDVLGGITEQIVAQLTMPVTVEDLVVQPGVSLGVARVEPGDLTASQVLERADAAMYITKRRRRPKRDQPPATDPLAGDFPSVSSLKALADAIGIAPTDGPDGGSDGGSDDGPHGPLLRS
ncbi:MAG: diguanylate cyclase domain-containing protein [Acidimicrobiales bacterium]